MNIKTVNIEQDLHIKLKKFCKTNNLKINELVNEIITDYLLDNKSELPLIYKNNKGEIIEMITCTSLSIEYKNSMPKELTLMRNAKNTGFIANYIQK